MSPHLMLLLAAIGWVGLHRVVAGSPVRGWLVARLGEAGYRASFSLLSLAALGFLIHAYGRAPCEPLWTTPAPLFWLPLIVAPVAFVFLVGAFTVPNPTAVGGEKALASGDPARGMLRITRHPFLWGVVLWSGSHLIVNGNVPALLLFGSLFVTALGGTRSIDAKRARRDPDNWQRFSAVTSNLPFAAIARGDNRLAVRELVVPLLTGLALAGLVLHYHTSWFGLSALRALR